MESDLDLALRAAKAGGARAMHYFAALANLPREVKPDGSTVTAADRDVEAEIRRVIAERRPDDAVLGEEGGQTGDNPRRWIIDPIDGTAMFVAGDNRWLVLVALEVAGEVTVGVAYVPAQDTIWWAERGRGAYADGVRISTSAETGRPSLGVVPDDARDAALLVHLEENATRETWTLHPALLVACGKLGLGVQTRGRMWDFAAMSLIVREAGGAFGKFDGGREPVAGPSVYARSEELYAEVLRSLNFT